MGVWQKTLFYLGLVDEDAPEYDAPYSDQPSVDPGMGVQRSYAPPTRGGPEQQAPTRQQQRSRQPMRSQGGEDRSAVSPSLTTGERFAADRRPGEPVMPQRSGVQGRRVEPPMAVRRRPSADRALSDSGVVVYAGWNNSGYGYVIVIDHGNGWQTLYGHLSGLKVGCGDPAFQGQQIGNLGCTGNCTGPHLHFEMLSDIYGHVNPLNFLP